MHHHPVTPQPLILTGTANNRIVADVYGDSGPPVLMLHGGGQTRHSWRGAARTLARSGRRAVAIDLRGHGDSDWVEDGRYRYADYAKEIRVLALALVERFGAKPAVVTASFSGLTSILADGLHRDATGEHLIAGYFIIDIALDIDDEGANKVGSFMLAHADKGFATVEEAADAVASYLGRPRPKNVEGLRKNLRERPDGRLRWHWDSRFMAGAFDINSDRVAIDAELRRAAGRITHPILLVYGDQSEIVKPEHVEAFRVIAPHARGTAVAGAHHMVVGEENDAFTKTLRGFFDEVWPV